MSDAGSAITAGGIAGAVFGSISGILTSALQASWMESRTRSADLYNRKIDEIVGELAKVNDLALRYWTSDSYLPLEHVAILNARSEIYALIAGAKREHVGQFEDTDFRNRIQIYYNAITGAGFGARDRHSADPTVPLAAGRYYTDCREFAESCRYRWSFLHILPWGRGK